MTPNKTTSETDGLEMVADHLANFFKDSPEKITYWWHTENLGIGGMTPAQFLLSRPEKFYKWFDNLINGDLP